MLKTLQRLKTLIFNAASSYLYRPEKEHTHKVVDHEKVKLKRDLLTAQTDYNTLTQQHETVKDQMNLWMEKSSQLQEKLCAALGHTTVLEGVLEESNKTIEALNLAIDLREKEELEGLQNYIDELETEMDEAVDLITKYGLQLRKM